MKNIISALLALSVCALSQTKTVTTDASGSLAAPSTLVIGSGKQVQVVGGLFSSDNAINLQNGLIISADGDSSTPVMQWGGGGGGIYYEVGLGTFITDLMTDVLQIDSATGVHCLVGSFSGSGSGLTSLNATQLTSGTVPVGRLSFTKSQLDTMISDDNGVYIGGAQTITGAKTFSGGVAIQSNTPAGNFVMTQNSVAAITSVETGAIANSLYVTGGKVGIRTNAPGAYIQTGSVTPPSIGQTWDAYFYSTALARVGIEAGTANAALEFIEAGSRKWKFGSTSGAFDIYDIAGGVGAVISIPSGTGVVDFAQPPTVNGAALSKLGMLTSDQSVTNSATLTDATQGQFTLGVGTWFIETLELIGSSDFTNAGSKGAVAFTGTWTVSESSVMRGGAGATTPLNVGPSWGAGTDTLTSTIGANGSSFIIIRRGRVVVTVAGTVKLQFAQNTAVAAQTATLIGGSYIKADRVY